MAVTSFWTLKSIKKQIVASVYCTHTDACILCLQHSWECGLGLCCVSECDLFCCLQYACMHQWVSGSLLAGWMEAGRCGAAGPFVPLTFWAKPEPPSCRRAKSLKQGYTKIFCEDELHKQRRPVQTCDFNTAFEERCEFLGEWPNKLLVGSGENFPFHE